MENQLTRRQLATLGEIVEWLSANATLEEITLFFRGVLKLKGRGPALSDGEIEKLNALGTRIPQEHRGYVARVFNIK